MPPLYSTTWGFHPHSHDNLLHQTASKTHLCLQALKEFRSPLAKWVMMLPSLSLVVPADHNHTQEWRDPGEKGKVDTHLLLQTVTCFLQKVHGVLKAASGTETYSSSCTRRQITLPNQSVSLLLCLSLSLPTITGDPPICLVDQNKLQLEN